MEENSNNTIIKGLAIILIAILGLNVYRTESTKKELFELGERVNQLTSRLDSLQVSDTVLTQPMVSSDKQTSALQRRVSALEAKINSLQSTVDRIAKTQSQASSVNVTSRQAQSQSGTATQTTTSKAGRISVSAKVKVENRYVQGTTYIPKITSGPTGNVIINVTVNRVGMVGSVSINPNSTISEEEILDACKEAALKTSFAYNPEAPDKSTGTITYTFQSR